MMTYSLITSVSIRRLPGDGEHIFIWKNNIVNENTLNLKKKSMNFTTLKKRVNDVVNYYHSHDWDVYVFFFFSEIIEKSADHCWWKKFYRERKKTKHVIICENTYRHRCRPNEWLLRIYICLRACYYYDVVVVQNE